MRHDQVGQYVVRVPVPDVPPGNLFKLRPRILLSQGETRPGMRQGQHWGYRSWRPPAPAFRPNMRLSNPVLR